MSSAGVECESLDTASHIASEELARRACSGCAQSFAELTHRFRPRLFHVVLARIGRNRHADAEDIVQESFARAWQKIASYDFQYRFSTWLFTIALRITTDHVRRRQRLEDGTPRRHTVSAAPPADAAVVARDAVDNMWSIAARELSELQYTALWLRYGEELAIHEVARALGKTRVGTRVLLHRARNMLAANVAPEESPHGPRTVSDRAEGDT